MIVGIERPAGLPRYQIQIQTSLRRSGVQVVIDCEEVTLGANVPNLDNDIVGKLVLQGQIVLFRRLRPAVGVLLPEQRCGPKNGQVDWLSNNWLIIQGKWIYGNGAILMFVGGV